MDYTYTLLFANLIVAKDLFITFVIRRVVGKMPTI